MKLVRTIEIHGTKYSKDEISVMTENELHMFCSFLTENELRWVQTICVEGFKHKIDNILFKV